MKDEDNLNSSGEQRNVGIFHQGQASGGVEGKRTMQKGKDEKCMEGQGCVRKINSMRKERAEMIAKRSINRYARRRVEIKIKKGIR